ncbi:MAG: hypothetical protein U0559_13995 [Anaerolineae bacterium]
MREAIISRVRLIRVAFVLGLVLISGGLLAYAFAEEPVGWRDPATKTTYDTVEVSTVHDDMTFVLALAAGFNVTDAKTLQTWNQLVDSEALPGAVVSYTNGGGAFYTTPNSQTICGGSAITHSQVIWPRWGDVTITDSVTSRFGPYMPAFHFPHISGTLAARDIGALHDWAWGVTNTLVAYEAYAWGLPGQLNSTVMQATCRYTRTAVITTSIAAGSLPAFATYLHTLADGYSHLDCITVMDELGMPWPTHTTPEIDGSYPACDYHPRNIQADDVHGREFYTYTDSLRTDLALRAVYAQLVARSVAYEGVYPPLDLNAPVSSTATLSEALSTFVHQWDFTQATQRRAFADNLSQLILMQRHRVYLPLVLR